MKRTLVVMTILVLAGSASAQSWVPAMRLVRRNYTDTNGDAAGTIARYGDSITYSGAFFKGLRYSHSNTSPDSQAALSWIEGWMASDCWTWQDDAVHLRHGNEGSTTTAWPMEPSDFSWPNYVPGERKIDYWVRTENPEIAVIMWGTNDLRTGSGITPTQYKSNLRTVVEVCKANGTIPILTTIPPRSGYDNGSTANQLRAAQFHQAVMDLAASEQVPLIEYHDEIIARHPHNPPTDTWDGSNTATWGTGSTYEVATLVARDGVHPSNYSGGRADFSEAALDSNGFNLRNYMTLMATKEVYDLVIVPEPATLLLLGIGGVGVFFRKRR